MAWKPNLLEISTICSTTQKWSENVLNYYYYAICQYKYWRRSSDQIIHFLLFYTSSTSLSRTNLKVFKWETLTAWESKPEWNFLYLMCCQCSLQFTLSRYSGVIRSYWLAFVSYCQIFTGVTTIGVYFFEKSLSFLSPFYALFLF